MNPSAKLPLTLPAYENDVQLTDRMWPGVFPRNDSQRVAVYSERLLVGSALPAEWARTLTRHYLFLSCPRRTPSRKQLSPHPLHIRCTHCGMYRSSERLLVGCAVSRTMH